MSARRRPALRREAAQLTRRRLLRAGRRAFARRGLAGANLRDDILRPARVSVGSFYHQFDDKTQLLLAVLEEEAAELRERLARLARQAPARDFAALARRFARLLLDLAEESPDLWRIRARERWSDDARVRRSLREERRRLGRWLCDEQLRLPGRAAPRARRERLAEYLLGLVEARAGARLEEPRRGRAGPGLGALIRFAAAGAAEHVRPATPSRLRARGVRG